MNEIKILAVIITLVAIAACDQKPTPQAMPEVNDANCTPANIQKLADKAMQQEFSGKCLRRGSFTPSAPKKW